ncbi:Acetamidase [Didymella keratinophila]|nr:Acetamidase [Didymella keratinophila]
MPKTTKDWRYTASSKKASLLAAIPPEWRLNNDLLPGVTELGDVTAFITTFLNTREQQITTSSPSTILRNIQRSIWTAAEVVKAFCHRAALAHQLTSCLSEIRFKDAGNIATLLDSVLQTTGQTVGPLHGLPISLDDNFHVEGIDSTCGYVSWIGDKKSKDDEGIVVQKLKQAGAIVFVKASVPMSMLISETTNNITGSTLNPYNRALQAGGASGGQGALLALRGSPFGWAADIAGSIRIPAAFNNLWGLRTSAGRISATGVANSLPGLPTAEGVVGPMCDELLSLKRMVEWHLSCRTWEDDQKVIDLPWRRPTYTNTLTEMCRYGQQDGRLVFAVLASDEEVYPHPPVQRAMRIVTEALLQRGYEVIKWQPPSHQIGTEILFQILGASAGKHVKDAVNASGEPHVSQLAELFSKQVDALSTLDFWELCRRRDKYVEDYHKYWKSTSKLTKSERVVDGVILPVAAHTAVPEGLFKHYAYTAVPSVLDYTTGSIPVTFADEILDPEVFEHEPVNEKDMENWMMYNKSVSHGSPIGVQLMGQRLQEEKVLAMMEAVRQALQQYQQAPILAT